MLIKGNNQAISLYCFVFYFLIFNNVNKSIENRLHSKRHNSTEDSPVFSNNSIIDLSIHKNNFIVLDLPYSFIYNGERPTTALQLTFSVIPPKNHGIIALIQSMYLRKVGSECKDYLEISEFKKDSVKTCGFLTETESNIIGRRMYTGSENNSVLVKFELAPLPSVQEYSVENLNTQNLQVRISLSAYPAIEDIKPTPIIYEVMNPEKAAEMDHSNSDVSTTSTSKPLFNIAQIDWRWLMNRGSTTQVPVKPSVNLPNYDDMGNEFNNDGNHVGWAQRFTPITVVLIFIGVIFCLFGTCHVLAKITTKYPTVFNRRETVQRNQRHDSQIGITSSGLDEQTIIPTMIPYEPPPPYSSLFNTRP